MAGRRKTYNLDSLVFINGHIQLPTLQTWHDAIDRPLSIWAINDKGPRLWPTFSLASGNPAEALDLYAILARHGQLLLGFPELAQTIRSAAKNLIVEDDFGPNWIELRAGGSRFDLNLNANELTLGRLMTDMQSSAAARWLCFLSALPYITGFNSHFLFPRYRVTATPAVLIALSIMCGFKLKD